MFGAPNCLQPTHIVAAKYGEDFIDQRLDSATSKEHNTISFGNYHAVVQLAQDLGKEEVEIDGIFYRVSNNPSYTPLTKTVVSVLTYPLRHPVATICSLTPPLLGVGAYYATKAYCPEAGTYDELQACVLSAFKGET